MKFEHANLVVSDLDRTLAFLKAAFPDWKIRGKGSNDWYGKPRNWVHFGTADNYITLNDHGEGENRDLKGHSTGLAHLGFVVDDLASLVGRLDNSGFQPHLQGEDNPFRRNAYFMDPAGFEFEFVQYFSDISTERNMYS
ncbi:VOC family protein [Sneathiella marina]|uniref:VOC family protein n=1 Tax=Sneathiella marina TaxID=2950108 RepID=UPI003B846FF2